MIQQAFGLHLTGSLQPGQNTVVMIAGTLLSPEVFERVTMPPGYSPLWVGWHDAPGPHSVGAAAGKIAEMLRQSRLGKTLLVGHSSGGTIAMLTCLSLTGTGLIDGLLLCNTGASNEGHANAQSIESIVAGWNEQALEHFLRRCFAGPVEPALFSRLMAYGRRITAEERVEPLISQRETDLTDRLAEITVPTIVAYGVRDTIRKLSHAELLQQRIPHAELVLLEGGHTPMVEDSGGFSQALARLARMAVSG